jgi:hypothetical protein
VVTFYLQYLHTHVVSGIHNFVVYQQVSTFRISAVRQEAWIVQRRLQSFLVTGTLAYLVLEYHRLALDNDVGFVIVPL